MLTNADSPQGISPSAVAGARGAAGPAGVDDGGELSVGDIQSGVQAALREVLANDLAPDEPLMSGR